MTTRKLTPAEALECLSEMQLFLVREIPVAERNARTLGAWVGRMGSALSALETLLSEHEAVKAKLAAYEQSEQVQKMAEARAGHAKWMAEQESRDLLRLAALKEPAAAVPTLHIEPGTFLTIEPGCTVKFSERVSVRPFDGPQGHPAAPVPSDEEIESAIHRWRLFELGHDKLTAMEDALRLLARRIGVQGVPQ